MRIEKSKDRLSATTIGPVFRVILSMGLSFQNATDANADMTQNPPAIVRQENNKGEQEQPSLQTVNRFGAVALGSRRKFFQGALD